MAVFCSSLMPCLPDVLLGYFLNDLEMVLFAPFIAGITLVFTFCVFSKSFRFLYRSNFYLLILYFLLIGMFLFHNNGLWYPV